MKPADKRFVLVVVLLMLVYVGMIGFWAMDVSAAAIANGGITLNILGAQDPYFTYHLGLVLAMISFFATTIIAAWGVLRK